MASRTLGLPTRDWRTAGRDGGGGGGGPSSTSAGFSSSALYAPIPIATSSSSANRNWWGGAADAGGNYGALRAREPGASVWTRLVSLASFLLSCLVSCVALGCRGYKNALAWSCQRSTLGKRFLAMTSLFAATALVALACLSLSSALVVREGRDTCQVAKESIERFASISSAPLPKIVHQQWKTSEIPPGELSEYREQLLKVYPSPEYTHMLWTDVEMRRFIQAEYAWFLPQYDAYKYPIQRADASRYFILHAYGGLYLDLDYEVRENFWNSLPPDRPGFIESPYKYNEGVQNSLMSSPPHHALWNVTFQVLQERAGSSDVLSSTGPHMVDEVIKRARKKLGQDSYYVLPCENFHRIPLGSDGASSPFLTRHFRSFMSTTPLVKQCGNVKDMKCQFGIHHNVASWSFGR